MDEEQGVPCTTANHKSTGTSKPSQAYNVPVQIALSLVSKHLAETVDCAILS